MSEVTMLVEGVVGEWWQCEVALMETGPAAVYIQDVL
jgi:hypothetical protein